MPFWLRPLTPPVCWKYIAALPLAKSVVEGPPPSVYCASDGFMTLSVPMRSTYRFTPATIASFVQSGSPFDAAGHPAFTNDAMGAGVKRYVDLMGTDKVMNPSDAQYTDGGGPSTTDFASGKAAMYFQQTGGVNGLNQNGMTPDAYGIVPIPAPDGGDPTGDSFVAGTNISIFKNTKHLDEALKFVAFMTSPEEQEILNAAYGTLPVVKDVPASAFADYPDKLEAWSDILANNARPLSLVPGVSAFQANVGGAVVSLMQQAATGSAPTEDDVRAALEAAKQQTAATS